ncbi:hypothetical protein EPO17_00055 [Patescibacteria group bacterium]|nr:MAG: hypothetical protein EPO17_00055 [Patescibacteria group bacterium]
MHTNLPSGDLVTITPRRNIHPENIDPAHPCDHLLDDNYSIILGLGKQVFTEGIGCHQLRQLLTMMEHKSHDMLCIWNPLQDSGVQTKFHLPITHHTLQPWQQRQAYLDLLVLEPSFAKHSHTKSSFQCALLRVVYHPLAPFEHLIVLKYAIFSALKPARILRFYCSHVKHFKSLI